MGSRHSVRFETRGRRSGTLSHGSSDPTCLDQIPLAEVYTDDYREEVYTAEGLAWVDAADFKTVLLRNIPSLASTGLANIANAFEPWDQGRLTEERHPLRACTKGLGPDPWAGDAST